MVGEIFIFDQLLSNCFVTPSYRNWTEFFTEILLFSILNQPGLAWPAVCPAVSQRGKTNKETDSDLRLTGDHPPRPQSSRLSHQRRLKEAPRFPDRKVFVKISSHVLSYSSPEHTGCRGGDVLTRNIVTLAQRFLDVCGH